jgi:ABC-type Zn uptake system ZnuABC Zn-binding protein ZnuA
MKNDVVENIITFQNNFIFFQKNFEVLKKEFSDKFVLIENKEVKLSERDIDTLIRKAHEKDIDVENAFIEFVPGKHELLLL